MNGYCVLLIFWMETEFNKFILEYLCNYNYAYITVIGPYE